MDMPKLIALISKQSHLSRAEFKAYYEASHAPLVAELLPMIKRYTRSFMPDEPEVSGKGGKPDFDVLTELWFEDEARLTEFWARIREPAVSAAIRADEANFLISEKTVMYRVDETQS
ncbi:MAG: EthD family reductase [Pseudomonadales bacterium]|nr:EthD family reductase [Pseudomonadales bacterium]